MIRDIPFVEAQLFSTKYVQKCSTLPLKLNTSRDDKCWLA